MEKPKAPYQAYVSPVVGDLVEFRSTDGQAPTHLGVFEVVYINATDLASIALRRLDDGHLVTTDTTTAKELTLAGVAEVGDFCLCRTRATSSAPSKDWFLGMMAERPQQKELTFTLYDGTTKSITIPEWDISVLYRTANIRGVHYVR